MNMSTKNKAPDNQDQTKNMPIKKKADAPKQRLIYCGPNAVGGSLRQFMVFKGGYPEHLKKQIQECPAIRDLCVPISEFNRTKMAVNTPGTAANQYYNDILRYSAGLKEGK
jgi:hypothetical protein